MKIVYILGDHQIYPLKKVFETLCHFNVYYFEREIPDLNYDILIAQNNLEAAIKIPRITFTGYWPSKIPTRFSGRKCSSHKDGLWIEPLGVPILTQIEHELNANFLTDSAVIKFIREEYKKRRLFYSYTRPIDEILHLLYEQVFEKLGLKYSRINLETGFSNYMLPIYEPVARVLGLEFNLDGYNEYYPLIKDANSWYIQQMSDLQGNSKICSCYSVIKTRLKFVHIPKTAGESIEKAALKLGIFWGKLDSDLDLEYSIKMKHDHHVPLRYLKDKTILSKYDFFTIVRNPYTQAISHINYIYNHYPELGQSREEVIENYFKRIQDYKNNVNLSPACDFVFDLDGKQIVKHVIKFEELDNLNQVLEEYGILLELEKENVTRVKIISELSREQIQIINAVYSKDFETFGYSKM